MTNFKTITIMTTKELKQLLTENRNVRVRLNEWELVRNLDAMSGETIYVNNSYRVEKSEAFSDSNEGIKFFMSKISYQKSFLKRKNIPTSSLGLEILINN